jgi:PST family polysaccharide transporter
MARLLTPQDYGLIGMVAFVTGFVAMYKDLGLSVATIQRSEINAKQISTLFWVKRFAEPGYNALYCGNRPSRRLVL